MAQVSGDPQAHRLARRRGDYGFDAPAFPIVLGSIGVAAVLLAAITAIFFGGGAPSVVWLLYGLVFLLSAGVYLHTTRAGKFQVWAEILSQLGLRGDERIVDLGCGRGAVLTMAAELVPAGQVAGVDIWQTRDQSGNAITTTQRNAELEGVASRVALATADMRALPFADASFDLALSSAAIHNIPQLDGRLKAIDEAVRVLKPGGRLRIADIRSTSAYAQRLQQQGMWQVERRRLGWRTWYGGPWVAMTLVSATKPE
jgi:ubiquinone/menaquinone biosynthesis C-methylase UbiE